MLVLGSRLLNTPVMSLQTGTRLAIAQKPLIDPTNLKVVAYEVEGPLLTERPSLLRTDDIREIGSVGMIVDSSDEFIGLEDVIKIKALRDLGFLLTGMTVIDEHGHKLGKVDDYTVDTRSFVVQQLNVRRGILKGITDTSVLIHRSQITEINDKHIVVKSGAKKHIAPVMQAEQHEFVNPFRTPAPQPETIDT